MSAERNSESYKHDPELGCGLLIVLAVIFVVLVVLAVLYGVGAFDTRPDLPADRLHSSEVRLAG